MPKKPPSNAFYFFMKECKKNWAAEGISLDMKETAERAGPIWKKLDKPQRMPYEQLAKNAKHASKQHKLTNDGQVIDIVQKLLKEKEDFKHDMIEDIEGTIKDAGHILDDCYFYLIHVNVFCFVNSTQRYYPAEIAVARFNLKTGVKDATDVYHSFCVPGTVPLGYAFTVQHTSNETHQIMYPQDKASNMGTVFHGILDFLNVGLKDKSTLPPIYAFDKNVAVSTQVMKTLCRDFGYPEKFVKVYSLEFLFFHLRNSICLLKSLPMAFPSVSSATLELEKDVYDYAKNISCYYHENSDVPNHCSRSIVMRWAYVVCDHCCPAWNIPLIPGQHVPLHANVHNTKIRRDSSSTASVNHAKIRVKNPPPSIGSSMGHESFKNLRAMETAEYTWENGDFDSLTESNLSTRVSGVSLCDWETRDRELSGSDQELLFLSNSQESCALKDTQNETSQTSYISSGPSLKQRRPYHLSAAFAHEPVPYTSGFSFNSTDGASFSPHTTAVKQEEEN